MKKQPRVAIYYRTNHFNNTSLQHLEAFAKKYESEPILFLDIASGVRHQLALHELLFHVRSQKVDVIITHSLPRFSRKASEVAAILSEFEKYNVKLIIPNGRMEVTHHE
jgi:DNA invertase Pin-like site-specific DNA recombinase